MYLENIVGIPLLNPEALDGYRKSHVFSLVYVRVPTAVADHSEVYGLLAKKIRDRYESAGFADLGKKP